MQGLVDFLMFLCCRYQKCVSWVSWGYLRDSFTLRPGLFALQLYKEQRKNSENVSHRSSESDVSEVSAISRTSSASRLSSTSYMSIQSERPRGRFRYPGPAPLGPPSPSPHAGCPLILRLPRPAAGPCAPVGAT